MNAFSAELSMFGNEAAPAAAGSRVAGLEAKQHGGTAPAKHVESMLASIHHTHSAANGRSLSLVAELRELYPETSIVVLLPSEKRDNEIGAVGLRALNLVHESPFNHVTSEPQQLRSATASLLVPIRDDMAARSVEATRPPGNPSPRNLGLTLRQAQVLELIAQGKPNKLICRELHLAEGTVKCHVSAILRALHVSTRTQAALKASRTGLGLDKGLAANRQ
ncbi:MAG: response regulator transcription factor [Burkholderiales bacterium]